jgi:hypothetical protein
MRSAQIMKIASILLGGFAPPGEIRMKIANLQSGNE